MQGDILFLERYTGSSDKNIKLWSSSSGRLLYTITGHQGNISALAFSPDGTALFSGSFDGTVRKWHAATGGLLYTIKASTGWISDISVSFNGTWIATGSFDWNIKVWDTSSGRKLYELPTRGGSASVRFSPNSRWLAAGLSENIGTGAIELWDTSTWSQIRNLHGHTGVVRGLGWSKDSTRLASSSFDNTVRLWNVEGKLLHTFLGHTASVWHVAFDPLDRYLVSGSSDTTARLWDLNNSSASTILLTEPDSAIYGLAFHPNGRSFFLSTGRTAKLKIFSCNCRIGQTRPCYNGYPNTSNRGSCRMGTQTCSSNSLLWDREICVGEVIPQTEVIGDNKDNNCDGVVDGNISLSLSLDREDDTSSWMNSMPIKLQVCLKNHGRDTAEASKILLYLSKNSTLNETATPLTDPQGQPAHLSFSRLAPNLPAMCLSIQAQIPSLPQGDYYVLGVIEKAPQTSQQNIIQTLPIRIP